MLRIGATGGGIPLHQFIPLYKEATMMDPYPWPSSKINPDLMSKLHHISQATHPRVPITELIKRALVEVYASPEVIEFPSVRGTGEMEAA
jgi:hypothetical protein